MDVAPEAHRPASGLVFLETRAFAALADTYLGAEGIAQLQSALMEDPNASDVIQGLDGARKIRIALPGRGKSGGARVIYFYRDSRNAVFFLALYPKNQKADLSTEDRRL